MRGKVSLRVSPAAPKAQGKRVLSEKSPQASFFDKLEREPDGSNFSFFCGVLPPHPIALPHASNAHCTASSTGTPHAKRGVRILWRHRCMAARAPML